MPKRRSREAKPGRSKRDPGLDLTIEGGRVEGYRWTPNARLARRLPPAFDIPFRVYGSGKLRLLRPASEIHVFLDRVIAGGLEILIDRSELSPAHVYSYRLMSQLFHWGRSRRLVHARELKHPEDLALTRAEKNATSLESVLPEDLLIQRRFKTVPMSASSLIQLGRAYAADRSIAISSFSRALDYGLFAAALESKDHLTSLTPETAGGWVRLALFGTEQGEVVRDAQLFESIEVRFNEIFFKHLGDTPAEFSRWMRDMSNITRTIAKRKGIPVVTKEQAKYVLLDLLWQSHEYVSQCVQRQMNAIVNSVVPRLSEVGVRDAALWYDPQVWLGGISPIAVQERLNLILPVLGLLTAQPELGDLPWRACLQTLKWRQEIVENRRKADLSKKRR